MFKEAFAGIFILFLFYLCYRFLWRKRRRASIMLMAALLICFCAANIIYNSIVMFPDYYMDTVGGCFRYGTFSENLFAYSDEFMFRDNILFPILRNRSVALDESAEFYRKYQTPSGKPYSPTKTTFPFRMNLAVSVSWITLRMKFRRSCRIISRKRFIHGSILIRLP